MLYSAKHQGAYEPFKYQTWPLISHRTKAPIFFFLFLLSLSLNKIKIDKKKERKSDTVMMHCVIFLKYPRLTFTISTAQAKMFHILRKSFQTGFNQLTVWARLPASSVLVCRAQLDCIFSACRSHFRQHSSQSRSRYRGQLSENYLLKSVRTGLVVVKQTLIISTRIIRS